MNKSIKILIGSQTFLPDEHPNKLNTEKLMVISGLAQENQTFLLHSKKVDGTITPFRIDTTKTPRILQLHKNLLRTHR